MRTIEGSGYKITYPEEIIFAFNPQKIVIEAEQESCTFGFSASGVKTLYDERQFYGGRCEIDFARYAQLMFAKQERQKTMTVTVDMPLGSFTLSFNVVWGALNIGDTWNKERTVTWFKNYPQTFGVFIDSGTSAQTRKDNANYQNTAHLSGFLNLELAGFFPNTKYEAALRVFNNTEANVWDITFDATFGKVESQTWRFVIDDSDSGIFLRWIDRHGWLQYWLFKEGVQTEKSDSEGDALSVEYADNTDVYHYGVSRQNKKIERTIKAGAVNLSGDNRDIIATIAGSPYVDIWNGKTWIPVRIAGTSLKTTQKNGLTDYEIEIKMPTIVTQTI